MFSKLIKKDRIKVFYTLSDVYADLCAVSIRSILHYTKQKVDFYILYSQISQKTKELLKSTAKVNFVKIESKMFKKYNNINQNKLYSFYKILIPDCFKNIKKAIFLHADTMFLDDIKKLYSTDISDVALAGVCDVWNFKKNIEKFNLNTNSYFNEGVLLVNFEKWRKENLSEKIKAHLDKKSYSSTEIINVTVADDKLDISPKFNYMEPWWYNYYIQYEGELLSEYERIKSHPVVVHFTGHKPTYPLNKHSFKEVWWEFASELKNYEEILEKFQKDVEDNLDSYEKNLKPKNS